MNRQETAGVLAVLSAAWPTKEIPDETAQLWASQLQRVLVSDALEAAAAIARSDEFFPSLHRFIDTCQACARRRASDAAHEGRQLQSDNAPYVTPEEGAENVRKVRETAAANPPPTVPGFKTVGANIVDAVSE